MSFNYEAQFVNIYSHLMVECSWPIQRRHMSENTMKWVS